MNHALEILFTLLNSPAVITALASVVAIVLTKIYTAKPDWAKYEGTIIAAVKWAEKAIPDDSENKSVRRLDEALLYVLRVFEERNNRIATAAEQASLVEGIQIVHGELSE